MKSFFAVLAIVASAVGAFGQSTNLPTTTLVLAWNASPTATFRTNITYCLYANLGSPPVYASRTNCTATVSVGVGVLQAELSDLKVGTWYFTATARDGLLESPFSNMVVHEQPAEPSSPESLRSVTIQHTAELPGGWQDIGVFRIKVAP